MLTDLRYAVRRLLQNRAFALVSTVSLALGIGANTAAFNVLYAVMFRPLPVRDPGSLVVVSSHYTATQFSMPYPAYTYLRDHASALDGLVAFRPVPVAVSGGATERATGMLVSGNYFDVLGVPMAIGSPINPDDDRTPHSGGPRGLVAVLSHQFWMRHFNGDAGVLGRSIKVDGHSMTVVGVAARTFRGTRVGALADVFVPMVFAADVFNSDTWMPNPRNNWLRIMGRVRPGVTRAQAQADLTTAFRNFNEELVVPLVTTEAARSRARAGSIILSPGTAGVVEMGDDVGRSLWILMGLVGLVMLIAFVNVASLLIARADRYRRDTAVSIALGASSARLWAQQGIETVLMGVAAIGLSLALATWMRTLLAQLVPPNQQVEVSMDARVIGVSIVLGLAAAVALAAMTGGRAVRRNLAAALKGVTVTSSSLVRNGLIVAQLALSLVMLVAAGLFGRTLGNLRAIDPGFDRERVLIASVTPAGYAPEARRQFYTRLLDEIRAVPGVTAASFAADEPLEIRTGWNMQLQSAAGVPRAITVPVAFISDGYFKTMGIPFVRGRDVDATDAGRPTGRAIVNDAFIRQYLGGSDPAGAQLLGGTNGQYEIIGVVKDSAATGLRELGEPLVYVPNPYTTLFGAMSVLHVRSAIPPAGLIRSIEGIVHRLDPDVPLFDVRTIEQQLDRVVGRERTFARLSSVFGALGLVLSAVGLYGLVAHAVNRRTKELGIRMALGAERGRVVGMIMRESSRLAALGMAIGLPCAYALARTIRTLFYGVAPGDWWTIATALAVLTLAAGLAAWLPARRAAAVDPLVALRDE